jgi:hypothetical protein
LELRKKEKLNNARNRGEFSLQEILRGSLVSITALASP